MSKINLEDKGNEIKQLLKYNSHLTFKIKHGVIKFYYESERYSRPIFINSFHENNFKQEHEFYEDIEKICNRIKSGYYYIDNKPIIKEK